MRYLLSFFLCFSLYRAHTQCALSGNNLTTSYTSNGSASGMMFDVAASSTLTVLCFDASLVPGTYGTYEVYYKTGSYAGSESNPADWSLVGSNAGVYSAGLDLPSPLDIPIGIVIPAGETAAFYITAAGNSPLTGLRNTGGTGYTTLASDANLIITGGVGKDYPFLATYANRNFNGTVHYVLGNVLPVGLVSFSAAALDRSVLLSWTTDSEKNNDYFVLERSANGSDWEMLSKVDGAGNSQNTLLYQFTDESPMEGSSYYRIGQTDFDGTYTQLQTRAVNLEALQPLTGQLTVAPNPAKGAVTVFGTAEELSSLGVYDLSGRKLLAPAESVVNVHSGCVTLDLSQVSASTLVIRAGNRSARVVKE